LALVFPWTLAAQEGKFIDCRERSCDVNDFLEQHFSVMAERLITKGYGKRRPRALHETESGRRQHRRIEVALLQP
jgi:outer membrane protein OmpA-like peptidoglycan-associated protein